MLMPRLWSNDFLNDWMGDFPAGDSYFSNQDNDLMKTDVKESENGYDVEIDLPGFKKEDVNAELQDGYLTITASRNADNDETDKDGKYIRRERY